MRKFLAAATLLVGFSSMSYGQGDHSTTLYYSVGIPMGNTADFTNVVSGRGFNLYYDYFVEDEFSLGFTTGIQTYYKDMGKTTETTGIISATGNQYRYLNQIPILMTGKYHFDRFANVTPHVGLGAGLVYTKQTYELGGVQAEYTAWQFTLQPEIGVGFEMSPSTDFMIGVVYNQGANSKEIDAMSSVVFNVGLRFVP